LTAISISIEHSAARNGRCYAVDNFLPCAISKKILKNTFLKSSYSNDQSIDNSLDRNRTHNPIQFDMLLSFVQTNGLSYPRIVNLMNFLNEFT
jgi:hypothetical protein